MLHAHSFFGTANSEYPRALYATLLISSRSILEHCGFVSLFLVQEGSSIEAYLLVLLPSLRGSPCYQALLHPSTLRPPQGPIIFALGCHWILYRPRSSRWWCTGLLSMSAGHRTGKVSTRTPCWQASCWWSHGLKLSRPAGICLACPPSHVGAYRPCSSGAPRSSLCSVSLYHPTVDVKVLS